MRTRVKICGITRVDDALSAVAHGADAIGLVFYAPSPRCVTVAQAASISAALPAFVSVVALFVDASPEEVHAVLANVHVDVLQFHGNESEAYCSQFDLPYLKAIRVKSDTNLIQYAQAFTSAKGLLLDTYTEHAVGGTGETFNWNLIPKSMPIPIILAGGLTVANVNNAIKTVLPYAVDVSGGVEQSKGVKDIAKIAAFMAAVND
ncbi:MAG: phosphoribosylanthranilate isomerase [Methylophilaceae bacterium]|nr:phosphoribosylanthranilate isomerase [Methylophilaceae bacterium]